MNVAMRMSEVSKSFGGNQALVDVGIEAAHGQITALVGPNGCGKSTTINVITGMYQIDRGRIEVLGQDVTGWRTYDIARLGVIRTFQTPHLFVGLSVLENALAGAHRHRSPSFLSQLVGLDRTSRIDRAQRARARDLLDLAGLGGQLNDDASTLSTGSQKMLDLCRALMADPRLLILDEPAAGLDDRETEELGSFLAAMRDAGHTVIFVEHNLALVTAVSDVVHVMADGQIRLSAPPAALATSAEATDIFLGGRP